MIRILPLQYDDNAKFCLYEDARLLAECPYDPKTGEIYGIIDRADAARPLYAALIKAVLSSLEYAGVETASCRREDLFPLLKALRFTVADGTATVSLKGYFDAPCEGSKTK